MQSHGSPLRLVPGTANASGKVPQVPNEAHRPEEQPPTAREEYPTLRSNLPVKGSYKDVWCFLLPAQASSSIEIGRYNS